MSFIYPSLLRPTTSENISSATEVVTVPKVELWLRRWTGEAIADNFNGKPLIDVASRPVFAELAIYELFRLSGWEARWVETYGAPAKSPKCYATWSPLLPAGLRTTQVQNPIENEWVKLLMQQVMLSNGNTFAGCWDVVGWHGETILFAELKRRKKDQLQATQPRWLAAGLQAGLKPENFLLVEWDFL